MKSFVQKLMIIFLVLLQNNLFVSDANLPVMFIAGAFAKQGVSALPSLQNAPNNNHVVNAIATAQAVQDIAAHPDGIMIYGNVEFHGNDLIIEVYPSIDKIHVSGTVTLNIPSSGNLQVFVGSVPYHDAIPGLTVAHTNSDYNFEISAPVSIAGSLTMNNLAQVKIDGSLLVVDDCSNQDYVSFAIHTGLVVAKDIIFDGSSKAWVCNAGTIQSTSGNIMMRNHVGSNSNGVCNSGNISASGNRSITFENNISEDDQGVYSQAGVIEAGVINLLNNQGLVSGVTLSSAIYTNAVNIVADCSQSNQSSFITTTIFEFDNHSAPLSNSAIKINSTQNCAVGGGALTTTGAITISGNVITIVDPVTITGLVIIDVPASGDVVIDGSSYDGSIPGFIVTKNQLANNFSINASISAATLDVAATVIISSGLSTTGAVTVTTGSLAISDYANNFTVGASVAVSSGAIFIVGAGIDSCSLAGNVVGAGANISLNSPLTFTGTISAQSLNIGDNVTTTGAVTVSGGSLAIARNKTFTTGGLAHDGLSNLGTFFKNNDGTLIATAGNIVIQNMNNPDNDGVASGTITASSGNVTIYNNVSTTSSSSGIFVCGSISGINIIMDNNSGNTGVYAFVFDPHITATGSLSMSNNAAVNGDGIFIYGNVVVSAGSGGITMSGNSSYGSHGIYQGQTSTITTTGALTMNHNSGNSGGVQIVSGSVQTNGIFTIEVADDAAELFDSSAVTIKRTDDTTAVPFNSFAIKVGGTVQSSYPVLNGRVVLAAGNQ